MGMKNEKKGFFSRMLSSEHKVFETSMFGISVVLTLALVIGIGYYISVAFFNHNTVCCIGQCCYGKRKSGANTDTG